MHTVVEVRTHCVCNGWVDFDFLAELFTQDKILACMVIDTDNGTFIKQSKTIKNKLNHWQGVLN